MKLAQTSRWWLLLVCGACAPRYPGPAAPAELARWTTSEEHTPRGHDRTDAVVYREEAATPTEPGDLFLRAGDDASSGPVSRGAVICELRSMLPREPLGPTPDLLVELDLGERTTRLGFTDARQLDFSLGLVDLPTGTRIHGRVYEDTLDGGELLLEGDTRFDGRGWRWTQRVLDRRTSLRCRLPSTELLDQAIEERLKQAWRAVRKQEPQARDEVRRLAALVGWGDPRVEDLRGRLGSVE